MPEATLTWVEPDHLYEGVGAHRNNWRFDMATALADQAALDAAHPGRVSLRPHYPRRSRKPKAGATLGVPYLVRRLDGIDGAHFQFDAGPVDFGAIRAIPTDTVWWKATQSTSFVDPTFAKVRTTVSMTGFRRFLPYHWLSSTTDPAAQAQHYIDTVGPMGVGEGPMGDFEEAGITVETCLAFMEPVEDFLQRPFDVYFGIYVAGSTLAHDPRMRMSKYGPRMMHPAAYVTVDNFISRLTTLGLLDMPIDGWQWGSGGVFPDGTDIPGISRVDTNALFNPSGYDRVCSIAAPTPVPVPSPTHRPLEADVSIINNTQDRDMADGDPPWVPGKVKYAYVFNYGSGRFEKVHLDDISYRPYEATNLPIDGQPGRFLNETGYTNDELNAIPDFAPVGIGSLSGALNGTVRLFANA